MNQKNERRGTIEIDGAKVEKELSIRKLTRTDICNEFGLAHSSFHSMLKKNRLKPIYIKMLEMKYGIKYDDIKPDKKEEAVQEETDENESYSNVDFENMLREIVRQVWEDQISFEVNLFIEGKMSEIKEQVVMAIHNELS